MMQDNSPPPVIETQTVQSVPPPKKAKLVFLVMLETVLLLAIFAFGFSIYQQINHRVKNLEQAAVQLHQSQQESAAFSNQYYGAVSQTLDKHQNALSDINIQLALLKSHTAATDVAAIKTAQIEYLIRQAKIALEVQHNIPNSLVMLQQAQSITEEFNQPNFPNKLNNFHEQLIKIIQQLQTIPIVDTNNLCEKFDSLKNEAPNLSILVSPKPNTAILENTSHQAHKRWYQRAWDNIKASLRELVIIRHREEKIPALMAPEEQLYLQENLQLLLSRAEWALLQHRADVYQNSLKQALSWIEKYYVQNSASTIHFSKELQKLMQENIDPHTPSLSPLIVALHGES